MTFAAELRDLWMSIDAIAIPIATLRDHYVKFPGIHLRFSQLDTAYRNLREIETALFEFIEAKTPIFGSKPEREFLIVARASLENAAILLEVGQAERVLLDQ